MKSSTLVLVLGITLIGAAVADATVTFRSLSGRRRLQGLYLYSLGLSLLASLLPMLGPAAVRYVSVDAYRGMIDILTVSCAVAIVLGVIASVRTRKLLRSLLIFLPGIFLALGEYLAW